MQPVKRLGERTGAAVPCKPTQTFPLVGRVIVHDRASVGFCDMASNRKCWSAFARRTSQRGRPSALHESAGKILLILLVKLSILSEPVLSPSPASEVSTPLAPLASRAWGILSSGCVIAGGPMPRAGHLRKCNRTGAPNAKRGKSRRCNRTGAPNTKRGKSRRCNRIEGKAVHETPSGTRAASRTRRNRIKLRHDFRATRGGAPHDLARHTRNWNCAL
jgi:hypothetical protein